MMVNSPGINSSVRLCGPYHAPTRDRSTINFDLIPGGCFDVWTNKHPEAYEGLARLLHAYGSRNTSGEYLLRIRSKNQPDVYEALRALWNELQQ